MKRKIVIHNHLPARRTRDAAERPSKELMQRLGISEGTPPREIAKAILANWEKVPQSAIYWARGALSQGAFDVDDLQRYAGDVVWADVSEAEYNKLKPGDTIQVEGIAAVVIEKDKVESKIGRPTKNRVKVRFKSGGAKDFNSGAFYEHKRHPMDVGREQEERNRDAAYRRTGITRVQSDGGPGGNKGNTPSTSYLKSQKKETPKQEAARLEQTRKMNAQFGRPQPQRRY